MRMNNDRLTDLLDFSDRCAVVTGGANGIGLASVRLLLAHGASVIIADRDAEALARLDEDIVEGASVERVQADVSVESDVQALFERARVFSNRVDILVNNVGIGARSPTTDLDTDTWSAVLDVNLTSCFLCSREFAKLATPDKGGAIVNVASIMGLVGNDLYPNVSYHASKGGLINLTRALAAEWAGRNIRVNAVAPTFVETGLTNQLLADPTTSRKIIDKTPLGKLASARDVANSIVFLASDAASMITGSVLPVDGGWLAV